MEHFTPELGQMAFGQPWKALAVPNYIEAALMMIRDEVARVEWNNQQRDFDPFGNTGEKYKTSKFEVEAYSWGDDEQPYNFKWRDFEISWYKRMGRGMSMNRDMSPEECAMMLDECYQSVLDMEKND